MKRKVMLSSLVAAGILTPLAATGARFSEPVVLHAQSSAPVTEPEELRAMVGKSKGTVALLVKRADAQIYIPVELG